MENSTNSTKNRFIDKLKALTPSQRAEIAQDGVNLLKEFHIDLNLICDPQKLDGSVYPIQYNGVLQLYFFYYLWVLREIDTAYVAEASAISGDNPAKFDEVKNYYLGLIQTTPVDMLDFVLNTSQARLNAKPYTPEQIIKMNDALTRGDTKVANDPAGIQLDQDLLLTGLTIMVTTIKDHLSAEIDTRVHSVFDEKKEAISKKIQEYLKSSDQSVVEFSQRVGEFFNDWAGRKEQELDQQGQYVMRVITASADTAQTAPDEDVEEVVIQPVKLFTPGYLAHRKTVVPIIVMRSVQELAYALTQLDLASGGSGGVAGGVHINPEEIAKLMPELAPLLAEMIHTLEYADRLIFAFQQLINTPVLANTARAKTGTH
ncbi:MAG: hypothetical protein FJ161_00425 [Gammaproteobacteria bacterium]|nr:hypothetical protein [Gammaproteobacteria bacterium]